MILDHKQSDVWLFRLGITFLCLRYELFIGYEFHIMSPLGDELVLKLTFTLQCSKLYSVNVKRKEDLDEEQDIR